QKSAHWISEVNVKIESEVTEELINIQSVEIKLKEENEISDLMRHKRIHTGNNLYKCRQCSNAFSKKRCLIFHQRIHSGEKPYQCIQCDKVFSQNSVLTRHMRTHTG
ncbi:unnamed protein product, partial [Meganyctiphanes norvegica]